MAHTKFGTNGQKVKRLSAMDIYNLTQEGLQSIFELDRTNCEYDAQSIWDLVIGAAVERTTLETMCTVLEDSPSVNIARTALKGILPEGGQIDELEQQLNTALTWRLPKKLLAKPLPCAIDLVMIPYHGKRAIFIVMRPCSQSNTIADIPWRSRWYGSRIRFWMS